MPSPDFLALLAPGNIVAVVIVVAMLAYTLTGGADFGGGVLDLLATGPRAGAQRRSIARAIGPIWEANHVWLLVVLVLGSEPTKTDRRRLNVGSGRCYPVAARTLGRGGSSTRPTTREKRLDG